MDVDKKQGADADGLDIHRHAVGRWEDESDLLPRRASPGDATVVGKIGDAEAVNLRVRLIALENILVALLADAPESQSELVREMARYISPRAGASPHRLTVEAARNMEAIVARAAHYKQT